MMPVLRLAAGTQASMPVANSTPASTVMSAAVAPVVASAPNTTTETTPVSVAAQADTLPTPPGYVTMFQY